MRSQPSPADLVINGQALLHRFDQPDILALVLMGSHARDDAGPFSDVDLVRFLAADGPTRPGSGSHLRAGRLVVVSDVTPAEVDTWFVRPELAVSRVPGLRQGWALRDRDGFFAALQARARAFVWDTTLQVRADAYANREMVERVEDAHKGLEGLRRGDIGRLLDAEFGLSWGLNRLVQVQRGVLLQGGSDFFHRVEKAVGIGTDWARWRRRVFGVTEGDPPPTLEERVVAGLRLYIATAELLAAAWTPEARPIIDQTVRVIRGVLDQQHAPPASPDVE
jgi:nucleotidyltransferase-like protein